MERIYIAVLAVLLIAGCKDSSEEPVKTFDATLYKGLYSGTWTNTVTGATGPATIDIALNDTTHAAALTLDFGGNYLGMGDPPPSSLTGTYSSTGAIAKGTDPLFGEYDVTIDVDGNILGVMKNVAGGTIPEMTYTGKLTATSLDADYVVKTSSGATMNSILRLTK